jgi:hypothetical protein
MTGHFLSGIAELDRTNKTFEDSGALRQGLMIKNESRKKAMSRGRASCSGKPP